jgi:hypothetical protein
MPRRELDFYETPPHYIAALLDEVNVFGRIYEPCSGEGAIADALRLVPAVHRVTTNDINPKRKADWTFDARTQSPTFGDPLDWVITNPPFSDELEILEASLPLAKNVAFLARLSFLEPTEDREYFLECNPPSQVIVLPRYSFRANDEGKKQTDNVTCAWLVWMEDRQPRRMKFYSRGRSQAAAVLRGLSE